MNTLPIGFSDVDTSVLVKAVWNYKVDDEYKKSKLIANFESNGQVENIIIRDLEDGTYEIVNGNHRYDVMVELGIEKCHVYNLGVISQNKAMRLALETNETRFVSDEDKLAATLDALLVEYDLSELSSTLPWSEEEIEALQGKINMLDEGMSEDNSSNDTKCEPNTVTFIIAVDVSDDVIEEELQSVCDMYASASMRVK